MLTVQETTDPCDSPKQRESVSELISWRSNEILPKAVQERIHRLLNDAVEDMDLLDREITRVTQHLANLKQQRNDETERIDILRIAISPLKAVPPEIIRDIFILCGQGPVILPSPGRDAHPWNLSQVCSKWRKIAQVLTHISTDIKISTTVMPHTEPNTNHITRHHFIRESLRNVLSRSTVPISLTVGGEEATMIADLINMFNQQFKRLSLRLHDQKPLITLARLAPNSFTHLESLEIRNASPRSTYFSDPISMPFQTAPALREVTIGGTPIQEMFLMPFAQLTSFQGTNVPLQRSLVYSIFRKCTSLVDLSLTMIGNDARFRLEDAITSQHIQSLHITSLYEADWGDFLEPLVCPSLQKLSLTVSAYEESRFSLHALATFISRSSCSVTALHIDSDPKRHDVQLSDSDFEPLFRLLPSLTDFTSSFITPPLVFDMLGNGILPALKRCVWRVNTDGVVATLDLFDAHTSSTHSEFLKRALDVQLECDEGNSQFLWAHMRFQEKLEEYRSLAPLYITLGRYNNNILGSTRPS